MSRRIYFIALCVISLLVGGAYYLLFKNNTILESIVCSFIDIMPIKENMPPISSELLNNHFCDFMWAFSLQSGLFAIFLPLKKQKVIISVTVISCGILWEAAQYYCFVGGTGDCFDVVMYALGSAMTLLFTIKKENKS